MKIGILGTGYVGLVTGACFAKRNHQVVCMDVDQEKIRRLAQCEIPLYEPGLREIVALEMQRGNLHFTDDGQQAIDSVDICIIAVGTPADPITNSADMRYVLSAARTIGQHWNGKTHIVIKSTIPVGSHEAIRNAILGELRARGLDQTVPLTFNPEFLREGSAVRDCLYPDRIILGAETMEGDMLLRELYAPFAPNDKILSMDIVSAEMTKYASNSMLATKISFINEIANICERVGADIGQVRMGMGMDHRIGSEFLNPGCGYGGSCFPKDICALIQLSRENGYDPILLEAVEAVNRAQTGLFLEKVLRHFGADLSGRIFAVWGLAFKPNTDDMRCAPAIDVILGLIQAGAQVRACDPQAIRNAQEFYFKECTEITYCLDPYDTLADADALIILTEWEAFVQVDLGRVKSKLKYPVVFDGRNIFSAEEMKRAGFCYDSVGMGSRKGAIQV